MSPVFRSNIRECCYSSAVEHFLGKEEVVSSSLTNSSLSEIGEGSALFLQSFSVSDFNNLTITTMAKEHFERTKPHVNIGTIGHVDTVRPLLLQQSQRFFTRRASVLKMSSLSTRLTMLRRRKSVVLPLTLHTSNTKQQNVTTHT